MTDNIIFDSSGGKAMGGTCDACIRTGERIVALKAELTEKEKQTAQLVDEAHARGFRDHAAHIFPEIKRIEAENKRLQNRVDQGKGSVGIMTLCKALRRHQDTVAMQIGIGDLIDLAWGLRLEEDAGGGGENTMKSKTS